MFLSLQSLLCQTVSLCPASVARGQNLQEYGELLARIFPNLLLQEACLELWLRVLFFLVFFGVEGPCSVYGNIWFSHPWSFPLFLESHLCFKFPLFFKSCPPGDVLSLKALLTVFICSRFSFLKVVLVFLSSVTLFLVFSRTNLPPSHLGSRRLRL